MQHLNNKNSSIILKILAKVIKQEREKQKKSLRLFADEFDIQKSLLSRIENGKNEVKIISLWTISEALGLSMSELFEKVEKELPKDFSLIEK
jgi:DNA-binding helix-turn-helix protein